MTSSNEMYTITVTAARSDLRNRPAIQTHEPLIAKISPGIAFNQVDLYITSALMHSGESVHKRWHNLKSLDMIVIFLMLLEQTVFNNLFGGFFLPWTV